MRPIFVLFALFALTLPPAAQAAFPELSEAGVPSVAPVLRAVTPGVVNIAVQVRVQFVNPLMADPLFRQLLPRMNGMIERRTQASGSGVIVDAAKGYVLTNNHVVQNAEIIEVTLRDKRRFKAQLIGRDPQTDIAVLKIPAENLTGVPMADSDKSEVGDFVLAIGNPFGLGQTVTSGIVSAVGRSGLGIEGYEDFIQTDAAINPGNSGGALVDLRGRLIGINTAILAPSGGNVGVGFAVPINMARSVMEQLLAYGKISRGRIGVGGQDITPEVSRALQSERTEGAVISQIEMGSPAEEAGLEVGDIVVAIGGSPVLGWQQFMNRVGLARVGDSLTLTIDRHGKELQVPVRIAPARPQRDQSQEQ